MENPRNEPFVGLKFLTTPRSMRTSVAAPRQGEGRPSVWCVRAGPAARPPASQGREFATPTVTESRCAWRVNGFRRATPPPRDR